MKAPRERAAGRESGDGARRRAMTRGRFVLTAAGAAAGALGYTVWVEPFWFEMVRRPLPVVGLPPALRGARIVQLSDLHIGSRVDEDFLVRAFAEVAALRPEIVVYTGDFMTLESDSRERLRRMFPRLPKGQLATVGVLGNHDYGEGWRESGWADEVTRLAHGVGIRILRNEAAEVRGLRLVGLDDLWSGRCDPAAGLRSGDLAAPTVVLSHNPDSADAGDWRGFHGWILAGHTHGGQCKPPFLPPSLLPVRNRRYTAGAIPLADGRTLYINRGLGYLRQVRFNVRPEVTVFTLT